MIIYYNYDSINIYYSLFYLKIDFNNFYLNFLINYKNETKTQNFYIKFCHKKIAF